MGLIMKNGVSYGGGSSSGEQGGHTIWNKIKTALEQRKNLWFKDAKVIDNENDDATSVEIIQSVTSSAFDDLPTTGVADGLYEISDESAVFVSASGVTYDNTTSGLTADDVQEAIDELNTNCPKSDSINTIELVTSLPSDASSHPEILYLIKET